uniref:Centrosomal protein 55 n=1 Tax=Strigops habroptila TaxID=2489341 RepID=A0A672UC42_STRHB
DQQREAYVRGLLGRIFELEQKPEIGSQQQSKEVNSEGQLQEEKQKYYDQLLLTAKTDLETERCTVTQLRSELNKCKKKYEETQREITSLNALLQSQQAAATKTLENENKMKEEKVQRLKQENEVIKGQVREEKKKSEDLLCQVQLLRKLLLKQQEEHARIALLEQQKLQESGRMELQEDLQVVFEEKLIAYDRSPSPKHSNLLDESFLECPRCKMQYPTSQHRELLAHIDFCTA